MYCTSLFTSCLYCLIWLFLSIYHITKSIIYHVNAFFTLIIILLSSNHLSWKLSPTQAQAQPFQSLVAISWVSSCDSRKDHGGLRKLKKEKTTKADVEFVKCFTQWRLPFFDFWEKLFWPKIENGGCFTHLFWTFF